MSAIRGKLRPNRKLIYGIGVNDADYVVVSTINGKSIWCPIYSVWYSMIARCYSKRLQAKLLTYVGCWVCEEWLYFSNFKVWMEAQNWQGLQLDKDLVLRGNKLYSPDTCIFVSGVVNSFISSDTTRNDLPVGVQQNKNTGRFYSDCSMLGKGRKRLGTFATIEEAANAYTEFKKEMAIKLAQMQTDEKVAKLILNRYLGPKEAL